MSMHYALPSKILRYTLVDRCPRIIGPEFTVHTKTFVRDPLITLTEKGYINLPFIMEKAKDNEDGGGEEAAAKAAAGEALKASIMAKVDALAMSNDYLKSIQTNANALRSCIAKIETVQKDVSEEFSSRSKQSFSQETDKEIMNIIATCGGWKYLANDFLEDMEHADRVMGCFVSKTTYNLNTERKQHLDLQQFARRVFQLLAWHVDGNQRCKYVAPYVPLVQSGGMGKTKLMYDLKTEITSADASKVITALQAEFPFLRSDTKISCKMILCYTQSDITQLADDGYYDDILVPESIINDSMYHEDIAYRMWRKLDNLIIGRQTSK